MTASSWSWLADAVLVLHTGAVIFVIGGLLAIAVLVLLAWWRWPPDTGRS